MSTPSLLGAAPVKAWQLKYWAFLTGLSTTGTKPQLLSQLTSRLDDNAPTERPTRIVSVDMGIRNLAYCTIEVPAQDYRLWNKGSLKGKSNLSAEEKEILRRHDPKLGESPEVTGLRMKHLAESIYVKTWKRMDLTQFHSSEASSMEHQQIRDQDESLESQAITSDAFTPSKLSLTALRVTKEILSHEPTTILIERQRFRSGSSAAIQEWTVRVNMLESMIWACLATLRAQALFPDQASTFPDVHAVSPAQVVNFWSSPASISLLPPTLFNQDNAGLQASLTNYMTTKTKLPKKFKIDIVRSWCRGQSDVQLKFNEDSWRIAGAFVTSERQTKTVKEIVGGKLDDLADSLLQAVTWVRWERNRRVLAEMWENAVEEANREKTE